MTSVVIQRLVPGRDSADNCEFPQLLGVAVEIPRVQFLDKFDKIVIHALDNVVDIPVVLCNGFPQVHFSDGCQERSPAVTSVVTSPGSRNGAATLLEHQRRKTPGISCDEVPPVRQEAC